MPPKMEPEKRSIHTRIDIKAFTEGKLVAVAQDRSFGDVITDALMLYRRFHLMSIIKSHSTHDFINQVLSVLSEEMQDSNVESTNTKPEQRRRD